MADGAMGYPGGLERRDYATGVIPALPSALRRISWGAVFAGLIVAIMVSLVLGLLGMAIGLGSVNPAEEANPFSGLGLGAAIWWVATSLIALFCGGWVAARMAGIPRGFDGALHGVLTWGLVTLITIYSLGTAIGRIVGGAGGMIGKGLSMAGQGAASAAPKAADVVQEQLRQQGIDLGRIQQETEEILKQPAQPGVDPRQSAAELKDVMGRIAKGEAGPGDRQKAVNIITARTGRSQAEAEQMVSRWETTAQQSSQRLDQAKAQAEEKAREWGQTAASGMSKASLWTFIALLLGGIFAALGGRLGIPKEMPAAHTHVRPAGP